MPPAIRQRRFSIALAAAILAVGIAAAGCRAPSIPTPTKAPLPTAQPQIPTPTTLPQPTPTTLSQPTQNPSLPAPSVTVTAQREPSGTLQVLLPTLGSGRWTHLLPGSDSTQQYADPVYNYLFSLAPDWPVSGKVQGELAETWNLSVDARELRVKLRKGVTFHKNYGELTTDDVKFTFDQYASSNLVEGALELGQDLESFTIANPYEFVMRFKNPRPALIFQLSNESGEWAILSKKYVESVGRERADQVPVGSGQYQLLEQTSAYITLEAAPGKHFLGAPDFKQIRFRAVPDEVTRVALLRAGEADIVPIGRLSIPAVKLTPGAKLLQLPYHAVVYVALGGLQFQGGSQFDPGLSRKDPWSDSRVRQAMNLAIDRQGIIDAYFAGKGKPATIPAPLRGWDKLPPLPYDVARSRTLLREAGFEKGFPIALQAFQMPGTPEIPGMLEAVAWMWQQVGIQSKIETTDLSTFSSAIASGRTAGLAYGWQSQQEADPQRFLERRYYGKAAGQVIYQDQTVFDILQAWEVGVDAAARLASEQKLAAYLRDQYAAIPIATVPYFIGLSAKVASWPNPINGVYPRGYAGIKAAR